MTDKKTSDEVAAIAARYMDFDLADCVHEINKLSTAKEFGEAANVVNAEVRSLAASCLAQARGDCDLLKEGFKEAGIDVEFVDVGEGEL